MLNITKFYLIKLFREFYCVNGRLLLMVAVFPFILLMNSASWTAAIVP